MSASKNKNNSFKVSGITTKYPSYRNTLFVSIEGWLEAKQKEDEAEGLWRIGDNLYDFTEFIAQHPGGAFWLERTKGTDITEPFASHHISLRPEQMLAKYKVRKAGKPRNYKFTMHEHGFYNTLKRRVRERLHQLNYKPSKKTDLMHFTLLAATILFSTGYAQTEFLVLAVLAALSLSWLTTATHNYFHQRDNWQMYTFNLSLMNFTCWRISHALSHHAYPNSLHDLEMSLFEPFLCWVPNPQIASKTQRIVSVIIQPVFYTAIYIFHFLTRVIDSVTKRNIMYWHDTIGFMLPAMMFLTTTNVAVTVILQQWLFIILLSSFIFGIIGLNAAHHDPNIYHDGDAVRDDRDWGLYQLDSIIDRSDVKGSDFLVLTHFGEHVLHHLFPTLDHSILSQLNDLLLQTIKEFKADYRLMNGIHHLIGQSKQLLRTTPNPVPNGYKKSIKKNY